MSDQSRDYMLCVAALFGAAGVGLGAYGTHGLHVDDSIRRIWETGVAYQMWHALAAFAAAWLATRRTGRWATAARLAGWLFLGGTVLFSGSLYCFVLNGIVPVAGAAPTGGAAMVLGWIALAVSALNRA